MLCYKIKPFITTNGYIQFSLCTKLLSAYPASGLKKSNPPPVDTYRAEPGLQLCAVHTITSSAMVIFTDPVTAGESLADWMF